MSDALDPVAQLPPLKFLVQQADLKVKKSLGQNFLFDLNLTRRIARAAKPFAETVFEIGPGPGGLTRALLLEGARHIVAIEKDERVIDLLTPLVMASGGRLNIMHGDALRMPPIWELGGEGGRQIVANLPYNIATALLLGWLGQAEKFSSLILMFQKEVALRLVAQAGSTHYGRLSVAVGWRCEAEILFDVPPQAFIPQPKITSSVVRLIPKAMPNREADLADALAQATAIGFGQRRKMLKSSFKNYGGEELLKRADINPLARPQEIEVKKFVRLAELFQQRGLSETLK